MRDPVPSTPAEVPQVPKLDETHRLTGSPPSMQLNPLCSASGLPAATTTWTRRCDACRRTQAINQFQSRRYFGMKWMLCGVCMAKGSPKEAIRSTMQL